MKKLKLLTLLMLSGYIVLAQTKEQYSYDAAGNRTGRITCTSCRQVHNTKPKTDSKDTTLQAADIKIALEHGLSLFPNPTRKLQTDSKFMVSPILNSVG